MTGTPPTRTRIEAWQQTTQRLSAASRHWRMGADQLESCAEIYVAQVASPGGTEWSGPGAEVAAVSSRVDRRSAYNGAEVARRLADVASRGAEGLRWGRELALAAIAEAESDGFAVTEDLAIADRWAGRESDGARSSAARAYREQIMHRALRLQTEDARLAAQLDAGAAELAGTAAPVWGVPTAGVAEIPGPGTGPAAVNRWWESLTPQCRSRLIAEHPPELGNLNGIPAAVRDAVNQAVMNDDLAGLADEEPSVRYRNAANTREGLRYSRGGQTGVGRPVLLWSYDPQAFNGRGKAVIAIGDPDRAHDTTVIVPGTGSSVAQGWMAGHDEAVNVYDQSVIAAPGRRPAVLAWMGYDTPDSFADRRISQPRLARQGAELLARDVNGLRATHPGGRPQHVTVIGHSYGATTVADAFAHGHMRGNDAILLGCPGADLAHTAADFHLDHGHVYVGSASTDPVSWIGQSDGIWGEMLKNQLRQHGIPLPLDAGLGRDPAGEGFGSIRFHAEAPGADRLSFHDHSHYYRPGGEALRSMTDIVTGQSGRLATDGLLAAGRHQPHIGTPPQLHVPGFSPVHVPHLQAPVPGTSAYIDPEGRR